jgi:hypothetical protein
MQDVAHAIGEETLPFPVEVLMMHEEMNATRITSFGFCLDGELLMRKGLYYGVCLKSCLFLVEGQDDGRKHGLSTQIHFLHLLEVLNRLD